MGKIMGALKRMDEIISMVLKAITITCLVFLTLLVSANIFVRFFPVASMHWFDEIIELLYAYLVFYGAAALWISREHFGVGRAVGKGPTVLAGLLQRRQELVGVGRVAR